LGNVRGVDLDNFCEMCGKPLVHAHVECARRWRKKYPARLVDCDDIPLTAALVEIPPVLLGGENRLAELKEIAGIARSAAAVAKEQQHYQMPHDYSTESMRHYNVSNVAEIRRCYRLLCQYHHC
jgi:hypothetical protein